MSHILNDVSYERQYVLKRLSREYAAAVDSRDEERFVAVFAEAAQLEIVRGASADLVASMHGHEELRRIPRALRRYAATHHLLGQASFLSDGSTAEGEVYCVASHLLQSGAETTNRTLYIRYQDSYCDVTGAWLIGSRRVHVLWSETTPADCSVEL